MLHTEGLSQVKRQSLQQSFDRTEKTSYSFNFHGSTTRESMPNRLQAEKIGYLQYNQTLKTFFMNLVLLFSSLSVK